MTIDEAARSTGVSKDMIRYYEKIGLIKPERRQNRYRDFSEDDLNTLVLIRMLSNSHIPLKAIKQAFIHGSAESLLPDYEAELDRVRRLRRQLRYREIALQISLECLQQCAAGGMPRICRYPERWAIWRSDCPEDSFDREQQALLEDGAFFHFLASLELERTPGGLVCRAYDRGLMLYGPHPTAERLPAQDCLRFMLTHEAGRELEAHDLEPYAQTLAREMGMTRLRAFCYQIFHHMGDVELCSVCVEIPLGAREERHIIPNI